MNQYIIPANSKRSQLIFSIFTWTDIAIVIGGSFISLLLMLIISGDEIYMLVIKLLPLAIALFLVVPIPNYHNVLIFIREAMLYIMSDKEYIWKGWCATSDIYDEEVGKKSN